MSQQGPKSASESQANRACDACRAHKVRCLPNAASTSKTCQRCARTDRQCFFTAPQKRKQRKRTDTRVAELEKEVQAMRALFDSKANPIQEGSLYDPSGIKSTPGISWEQAQMTASSEAPPELNRMLDFESTPEANNSSQEGSPLVYTPDSDVVDRGIVSLEGAYQLFQSYNENLVQHYPGVVFAADFTAEECRRTKPALFLAVIAAAAGQKDPCLYSILNVEVLKVYATRMVMRHEKSLELVQALIVSCVWYRPPGSYGHLKFYEYIHMAATMAVDIGLGKNPKDSRSRRGIGAKTEAEVLSSEDIENRRTFLVCYMITTG